MRRLAFLAFCAHTVFGCGLVVTGLGVGSSDGGLDGASGADATDGTTSDGTDIETDGGADDGAAFDATADGDPNLPDSTPLFVPCTFNPCSTAANQFCCIGKGTCEGNPSSCGKYKEVYCDEPLDCPGSKCCLGRNSAEEDKASFRCMNDCSNINGVRVCRTSADCVGTTPQCIAVSCLGYRVGTCGGKLPPQCADGG